MRRRIINAVAIVSFAVGYGALMYQQGLQAKVLAVRAPSAAVEIIAVNVKLPGAGVKKVPLLLGVLGLVVTGDAIQQVRTALEYEHWAGAVFGYLDFLAGFWLMFCGLLGVFVTKVEK